MAKTNLNIGERPTILIFSHITLWEIGYDAVSEKFYLEDSKRKIVSPKEETLKTGNFRCFTGRWGYDPITVHGEKIKYWDYWKKPQPVVFKSMKSIYNMLATREYLYPGKNMTNEWGQSETVRIWVRRESITYYNTRTQVKTNNLKIAKTWFKGENPIWTVAKQSQQVGMWVDGKKDHVEVSFYYINGTGSQKTTSRWTKVDEAGFWLYPDGSISHFYKGHFASPHRPFCKERVFYRSFDHRFKEMGIGQYNFIDLRSTERPNEYNIDKFNLAPKTLKILEKVGFSKTFWGWDNNAKIKLEKSFHLIDIIKYKQTGTLTKQFAHLATDNLGPLHLDSPKIIKTDEGVVIRLPDIHALYIGENNNIASEKWRLIRPKLYKVTVEESYRIFISNNLSKIGCLEKIHEKKDWSSCKIDNVGFPKYDKHFCNSYCDPEDSEHWELVCDLVAGLKSYYSSMTKQLVKTFPTIQEYLTLYCEQNKISDVEMPTIFSLIRCIKKAPHLVETLIKTGHSKLLTQRYSIADFDLSETMKIFNMSLSNYKEKKGNKLWKNLHVSKEQFRFALNNPERAAEIFDLLTTTKIPLPVTVGTPMWDQKKEYKVGDIVQKDSKMFRKTLDDGFYIPRYPGITPVSEWELITYPYNTATSKTDASAIPFKYFLFINELIESRIRRWDISHLFSEDFLSFAELEVIKKRGLSFQLISDYHRMLERIYRYDTENAARWVRLPQTPAQLQQLHDEAVIKFNILQAEEHREWRRNSGMHYLSEANDQYGVDAYSKKLKSLKQFEDEDDTFKLMIPQKLSELVDEGVAMDHCVGTYCKQVAAGQTFVFFLRKKENLTQSFVTLNIVPSAKGSRHKWQMDQAYAHHDTRPNDKALNFIKEWSKKHNVDFSTLKTASHY